MSAALIYVTTGDVSAEVAAYKAAHDAKRLAVVAWNDAFNAAHPTPSGKRREVLVFSALDSAVKAMGVTHERGETAPRGWKAREYGPTLAWVPDRRYREGKSAQADLDGLTVPSGAALLRALGMPSSEFHGHKLYSAGMRYDEVNARVVATWGTRDIVEDVERELAQNGSADRWREMPRSEYFAWAEATEGVLA
jgi:hypothetical protein